MAAKVLVFYGSYREPRYGIRLANFIVTQLSARGLEVELVDAQAVGLPILGRMYKEYPKGAAPSAMEDLAGKIKAADGFVFVCGEYNWGVQAGLKNLTDHFFEEWFWRPAAIASYSLQPTGGARANYSWHNILNEMGMVVSSSSLNVGGITDTLDEKGAPIGKLGASLSKAFPRFADDLLWWVGAAKAHRAVEVAPY